MNFLLAEHYAAAVTRAWAKSGVKRLDLVGCHGQTIYHQGHPARYLGRSLAVTWQMGEGAVLAARLGVPVVSDFRPADMAAGGKGAPLVPFLDYLLFRHRSAGRIVQNLGGIGNLTAIPAASRPEQVFAFDTGPSNMVVDALMERFYGRAYDNEGRIAARGSARREVVARVLRRSFFQQSPPKTAGREEFGREFAHQLVRACGRAPQEDVVATATLLTARSIGESLRRFVLHRGKFSEYIASGGGTRNPTLMRLLAQEVEPLGMKLRTTDALGLPSEAKEAVAFAVMAYETWHRRPSNLPSATGAQRPAILGKISYA